MRSKYNNNNNKETKQTYTEGVSLRGVMFKMLGSVLEVSQFEP